MSNQFRFFFMLCPLGKSQLKLVFIPCFTTWLKSGHTNPLLFRDTGKYPSAKVPRTSTHCSHRSGSSAQGNDLQRHHEGPDTSQLHLSSCVTPAVVTEPTPTAQPTPFSPNGPNCQPCVGIWEPLANKLEHSWHLVQDLHNHSNRLHIPFPPRECRHAHLFFWRGVQEGLVSFECFSCWFACITDSTSQGKNLSLKRMEFPHLLLSFFLPTKSPSNYNGERWLHLTALALL